MKLHKQVCFSLRCLLSLLCAVSAPQPLLAQEAITLYGVLDLALISDRNSGLSTGKIDSGQQTASRFGIKGNENLGGGMQASFQIESQLEADVGGLSYAGRFFGSQAWVGLSGDFGSIKLGRIFTPYFGAIATNDPFDAKGPGEATRVFQDSGVRMDNSIKYSLPKVFGGYYADVAYGMGEAAGDISANRVISADAGYAAGPLNCQVAFHDSNDKLGILQARSALLAASYDFGPAKVWLQIAHSHNATTLDTRDTLVGVSVPLRRGSFSADYVHKADKYQRNADVTQFALGYYYPLSIRSNLYLVGSRLTNGTAASYQTILPGATRSVLALGMRHQF